MRVRLTANAADDLSRRVNRIREDNAESARRACSPHSACLAGLAVKQEPAKYPV